MHRRLFLSGLAAAAASSAASAATPRRFSGSIALQRLEARVGGRLGAFVFEPASGRGYGWRGGERFALCSTFKLGLAAFALREIDAGRLNGAEVIPYSALDLLPNSPVAQAHEGKGDLTIMGMIEGAQKTSDNLCANLVMRRLGGPAALTAFWRDLGDQVSRLDRYETALNRVLPGERQDTTTPEAMARNLAVLLTGNVLSPASRATLLRWMVDTVTGRGRIRGGLPVGWRAGDKTGTALSDDIPAKLNDVAVTFPPAAPPLVIIAYYEPRGITRTIRAEDEAVLAEVGRIAADPRSWKLRKG